MRFSSISEFEECKQCLTTVLDTWLIALTESIQNQPFCASVHCKKQPKFIL